MAERNGEITVARSQSGFRRWVERFRPKAAAAGIRRATFDKAFRDVRFNPKIIEHDRNQSEFTQAIWDYLDIAVSPQRVRNGRAKHRKWRRELAAIEARYGVEAPVLLAVWGLETAYGQFTGGYNVIEAYATLAYDGRRRRFAERQLISALRIVQAGDKEPSAMTGSWAGAMGHTQFIPTSFEVYAVDFTGDGARDIWWPPDALASTANFLSGEGWTRGQPWGTEVRLPGGFDFANAGLTVRKPVRYWNALGVRLTDGSAIPDHGSGSILTPAGADGPAFVVFRNFRVIRRYNNAMSYALAVGHLGDRISGAPGFRASWPRHEKPLTHAQTRELQRRLTARGFSTGGIDGKNGPNTTRAVRAFQRSIGITPDGYASTELLHRLR